MDDSLAKSEDVNKPRKSGGRPVHDGWTLYHFEKVDGDKGKSVAKCIKCLNLLKNTTITRLLAHRKKCGRVPETILHPPTTVIQSYQQPSAISEATTTLITIPQHQQQHISKIELEEYEEERQPQHHEVLWTQTQSVDTYMDESVNAAVTATTAMDIVNEDIRRHRKSHSQQGHKRRSENASVDAALSSFLIGCNLTFDVVDSKHFKSFVSALNPEYKMPSSSQLTSKVLSQLKGSVESGGGGGGGSRSERLGGAKRRKYYSSNDDSDYD